MWLDDEATGSFCTYSEHACRRDYICSQPSSSHTLTLPPDSQHTHWHTKTHTHSADILAHPCKSRKKVVVVEASEWTDEPERVCVFLCVFLCVCLCVCVCICVCLCVLDLQLTSVCRLKVVAVTWRLFLSVLFVPFIVFNPSFIYTLILFIHEHLFHGFTLIFSPPFSFLHRTFLVLLLFNLV